ELLSRAFTTAISGRQGPVVIGLPEDLLYESVAAIDASPVTVARSYPAPRDIARLQEMLAAAKRPLAIFGGSGWTAEARGLLQRYVEANAVPVATAFRRQDRFDNSAPNYVGDAGLGMNPRLAELIREADLLLAVGTRLGDITTQHYALLDVPRPRQRLVHVHPDPEELGRVYQPELAICAGVGAFVETAGAYIGEIAISDERKQ